MSARPHAKLLPAEQPTPPSLGGPGASIGEKRAEFNKLSRSLLGLDGNQPAPLDMAPGITPEWIEAQKKELNPGGDPDDAINHGAARMYLFVARRETAELKGADALTEREICNYRASITSHFKLAKGAETAPNFAVALKETIVESINAMWRSTYNGLRLLENHGKSLGDEKIMELKQRVGENLDAIWRGNPSEKAVKAYLDCQYRLETPLRDGPVKAQVIEMPVRTGPDPAAPAKSTPGLGMPFVFAAGGMKM